jgi:hypothetical protein
MKKYFLPEQDSEETEDSRYSTPVEALKAYQEEIVPLENFYQNEQIKIQELEKIG